MQAKKRRAERPDSDADRSVSRRATPGLLRQRALDADAAAQLPTVRLRSATFRPFLYRKMIGDVAGDARPGDVVRVLDKNGALFGVGLYNPRSEIVVRVLSHSDVPGALFWRNRLDRALSLRRDLLRLDAVTDAYRLVHAEADGLSGLVVDRMADVLSVEVFSLGIYQRIEAILRELQQLCGARHWLVQVPDQVHGQEGFLAEPIRTADFPRSVTISEFGTRFRVQFDGSHKTGFFCDQRENRRRLAEYCPDRTVLDLCCYTGGFAIQAKRLGGAGDVTAVDLDEKAIAVARENANLNQMRVHFIHADVFAYMRDMIQNGRRYDVVVLDPPKLIRSRQAIDEGRRRHFDLNRLAMQLVMPGGLLLSCSCAGLLPEPEFLELIHAAARKAVPLDETGTAQADARGRSIQILHRSGAAADHPVTPDCPETEYLKAVWMRVH